MPVLFDLEAETVLISHLMRHSSKAAPKFGEHIIGERKQANRFATLQLPNLKDIWSLL